MSQNIAVLNQEIQQNRECVNSLKEATEFLFQELKDVKAVISNMKTMGEDHQKRITELEDKLNDTERYQRRWNLRLYGLAEQEGEDVKIRVVEICRSVIPENEEACQQHIDVSHRVGRKSVEKIRPVIIRFVARSTRDLIWKNASGPEYLKSRKLRFGEDLTTKDKEARNKLWPQIDAARKEGKRAFYVGAKAIIDGKERFKADFYFLQETHALGSDYKFWRNQWGDDLWLSYGSSNSAGVAILRGMFKGKILKSNVHSSGRWIILIVEIDDNIVILGNIYGYNNKAENQTLLQNFEEEISGMLLTFSNANLVLGGDWNT
ncbi:hypothetical protein PO909_029746 [Leuciscus waleckii]